MDKANGNYADAQPLNGTYLSGLKGIGVIHLTHVGLHRPRQLLDSTLYRTCTFDLNQKEGRKLADNKLFSAVTKPKPGEWSLK